MKPSQLAKDWCANFRKEDGGCLGAIIEDDLSILRCASKPTCLMNTGTERCAYLETTVLPMLNTMPACVLRYEMEEAVREYRLKANVPSHELPRLPARRRCPDCKAVLEGQQRFCPKCARFRRRESNRTAQQKKRMPCQQLAPGPC